MALIDKGDFGAATSFNSLKTVHGGLRSLQRGNLREVREFIRERRAVLRIAPHLVEPLRFLVPTYAAPMRSRLVMGPALALYDLVARDRNEGLDPARRLEASRLTTRSETLALFPGLAERPITGGASWSEGQILNSDRLLLAFVQSAARAGASVANYVGAGGFLRSGAHIVGVSARDELTGSALDIRARITVNAAGAWAAGLAQGLFRAGAPPVLGRMSRAFNLVTRLPAPACALGDQVDGRFLFRVPWRGVTVFGTLHLVHEGDPGQVPLTRNELESFLRDLNRAFPGLGASVEDVTLIHRGLLPMEDVRHGEVQLVKRSQIRDHRDDGVDGLVSVVGVRYTTARHTAQQVLDTVASMLGQTLRPSLSATTALAGGDIGDIGGLIADASRASAFVPASSLARMARAYGTGYRDVLSLVERDPALATPLGARCPVTRAEVIHGARQEMGPRLADVVLRRTEAGSAGHPGRDALGAAAALLAQEFGWDASRTASEVDAVERLYGIPD